MTFDSDSNLDAHLRDVPLPEGMLRRLRGIGAFSDEELDAALRRVPVPASLSAGCLQVVADEQLDEQIRDVPLPWGMLARLRIIPELRQRRKLRTVALAASLLLAVSAVYYSTVVAVMNGIRQTRPTQPQVVWLEEGPLSFESADDVAVRFVTTSRVETPPPVQPTPETPPAMALAPVDEAIVHGPAGQLFTALRGDFRPWDDVVLMRWGPLGYPSRADDDLPQLETVVASPRVGTRFPLVRGYDSSFLFRTGFHPVVYPAVDPALQQVTVPLSTGTYSYDLTRELVRESRRPRPADVRTEHFLATIDYAYEPAAANTLSIRTAAGPAIFNPSGAGLLQVGVLAGMPQERKNAATHLTVAIDISASMRFSQRLRVACEALQQTLAYLGPLDQLSVVLFNEQIVHRVESISQAEAHELLALLDQVEPDGGTDIARALQESVSLAIGGAGFGRQPRLVLITDDRGEMPLQTAVQVKDMLRMSADHDLRCEILDVSNRGETAKALADLAACTGGSVHPVSTASDMRWTMVEALTGQSSVVATDAQLTVNFNPKVVAAYRLVGNEADPASPGAGYSATLRAAEAATVLFEVWLLPGRDDTVAEIQLEWKDARDEVSRQSRPRRVSRIQFATSPAEAPLELQAATLVAEAAEILRDAHDYAVDARGVFVARQKQHSLDDVLAAARNVNPQLSKKREFQDFLKLLEDLK